MKTDFPNDTTSQPQILIADDHAISMLLAKTICTMVLPNAIILQATNGKEAVDFFKEKAPDIVLMDVNMPEMNGCEATIEIRQYEQNNHVPIIGLSAGILNTEKNLCLESGMDDYLCKPILKETLAAILIKWLPNIL